MHHLGPLEIESVQKVPIFEEAYNRCERLTRWFRFNLEAVPEEGSDFQDTSGP
jgi:hypothetical protein